MSKQYTVNMKAFASIVVIADSEDEALDRANEVIGFGDFQLDESEAKEIESKCLSGELLHADIVDYDLREARAFAKENPFKPIPARLLKKGD